MAHVYVRSGAGGAGTGADWTNAYTTLAAAFTAKAAGDQFWAADDHAETQASVMTMTSPGTAAAPCTVRCVDRTGTVPPVAADLRTTATITTTGNNALNVGDGYTDWYGVTISAGSGAVDAPLTIGGTGNSWNYFKSCLLKKAGTSGTPLALNFGLSTGNTCNVVILDNTALSFGSASDGCFLRATHFTWINTPSSAVQGTAPTVLFGAIQGDNFLCEGVDFSNYGTGKTLVRNLSGLLSNRQWLFKNCKLGASVTKIDGFGGQGPALFIMRSDSAGTNYLHEKYNYAGQQEIETTIIRTGGATDGTTPIAWKIITTADCKRIAPFESITAAIWNDTTAANVTVTIYGIWGGGAVPTSADIWPVVSYMGSGATPLATIVSGAPATALTAGANWTSDGSTWGGSTTAFKMSIALTSPQPAMKGPIYVTIMAAKASDTFYIDPKLELEV